MAWGGGAKPFKKNLSKPPQKIIVVIGKRKLIVVYYLY